MRKIEMQNHRAEWKKYEILLTNLPRPQFYLTLACNQSERIIFMNYRRR